MLEKDVDKFLNELAVSKAWADDFASAIQSENDLEILKEAASLKSKNGERLYDNFQLFQFLGDNKETKLALAKKFIEENPEFSSKNFNLPVINYIIKNNLTEEEAASIIQNAGNRLLNRLYLALFLIYFISSYIIISTEVTRR